MGIAWGLDGSNGTNVRPAHKAGATTWAKDESAPGANDGTRLTASVINRLIGNIRALGATAGVSLTETSDNDIANCILALIAASVAGTAPLSSPAFTGTPTVPTAVPGTNSQQIANTAFVAAALAALVNSSPAALDTLNELAAAIGSDPNFATTITNALAAKAPLASPALTGTPTSPTASPGTNTQQIASTAFVQAAIAVATGLVSLPKSAADMLGGEEGVAIDFVYRTLAINDYSDTLTDEGRPSQFLTVTRSGTVATYFGRDGLLYAAAANTLRYDHNPATGVPLGVLIEGARTNVCLYNRDLTNAAWTKTNCAAVKDQVGLDGVAASASKLTASAANGTCLQAITLASSARFQSAYVKRLTGTGAVEMTTDGGTTWTAVTVTSAWTRVSIPTQTLANPSVGFRLATNGDAIAIDFVQNEDGVFATSPIETTSVAVVRNRDDVSLPTSLFPLSAITGTLVASFQIDRIAAGFAAIASLDDATLNERLTLFVSSTNQYQFNVVDGGAVQAALGGAAVTPGVRHKMGGAWAANNISESQDGSAALVDTSATLPTVTQLRIGNSSANFHLGGWVRSVMYLSRRVTDAELALLTAGG